MEHKQEPKVDHAVEQTPQENHSSPSAMADSTPTSNHADGKPEENRDTESGLPGLEEQDDDGEDNAVAPTGVGVVRKKKKKSKSKSKRGLTAPTGFEEFYVDVPITPAEYEEEQTIYATSLPFSERVQTAIQRYFSKRKFDNQTKNLFDKYMSYGGIDAGPKMFSGGSGDKSLADDPTSETKPINATHFVAPGRGGPDDTDFVVDFETCAKGFLSSYLPYAFDLESKKRIKSFVAIIRNFLNYLLHHDVCPEYVNDINATRTLCNLAEQELSRISEVNYLLPGNFNRACSRMFGGFYRDTFVGDQEWAEGVDIDPSRDLSPEESLKTFKIGLTAHASEEVIKQYTQQSAARNLQVIESLDTGLEVTALIPADEKVMRIYKQKFAAKLQPLGKMKAKTWQGDRIVEEDLTEEEEAEAERTPKEVREYEFWIESELLQNCFIGMKLEATVHRLSCGLDFFDAVSGVFCSFHTVLPNELIIGWKEPGPRLPYREANATQKGEDHDDEDLDD